MGTSLPPKEANLFKVIAKSYETKQYKKGLKASDNILKKFPDHGETLAMRGLTLNCMDRKAEAYELVRRGVKNDLKSHVCWHVYGLLYRSDREYREAIKCYRNALRIDPENIQILRDLSLLQAQMRDTAGFVETRRQLLTIKPSHRANWIGFAIAHHSNHDAAMAVQILEAYEGTLEDDYPPDNDGNPPFPPERYEHSEMLLYKVTLLDESGAPERALAELNSKEQKIVDKVGLKEHRAALLVTLNRLKEAQEVYRYLLDMNPDNYSYYDGLQKCLGLSRVENGSYSPSQLEKLVELYTSLQRQYPKSSAAKRIPLDFLQGIEFVEAAKTYITFFLSKGVPSLFSDIRPLYDQRGKADYLEEIITGIESCLKETGSLPGKSDSEPPPTLMWTLFLLAQHYDRRRKYEKALEKIDEAIKHTPTAIDLYLVKGRIMKHAGDRVAAAALADEARSMDLADRFINSECVKRMLQADQVDLAEKTAVLFTKDGDQHNNLFDMQCMWYELASGDSYWRKDMLGKALKNYLAVEKHYTDMLEDQFDFHTYCLRKMTLRAYVRMLKFEDTLHSHRFFCRAAAAAIKCYVKLHDTPPKTSEGEEEIAVAGLSPAERKRVRQKMRKAEAKAKKMAEEKAKEDEALASSNVAKSNKKGSQATKQVDDDPDGDKLLHVSDPLEQAVKYAKLLQDNSAGALETHMLAFEIYFRKRKILLAFQAVKKLLKLDADNPNVHRSLIYFFNMVDNLPGAQSPAEKLVQEVISVERDALTALGNKSLLEMNKAFLEAHKESLLHRAAAAEVLVLLSPDSKEEAVKVIEDSVNPPVAPGGAIGDGVGEWELDDCVAVHKILLTSVKDEDAASRWRVRMADLFPHSTYFMGPKSSAVLGAASQVPCSLSKKEEQP
ncbi:N-alpha-acetyltransferase 15/16, NatA auxiliary subunit [Marchantia polymorpha subsp. ruderalis]|nr:hypothetical protein MARPO_0079s0051 [Marchantia polymorpha]BBN20005.1 hypothetical protein Mp_8g15620 [Marchantia polymorpha subsp. ruderalis]|eukprot:PTQ34548.1 hypothetical protein MARPO_0079s0051 [Marchantia polymorpha]